MLSNSRQCERRGGRVDDDDESRKTMITELLLVLAAVTAWWLYAARLPPDYPPMPPVRLPFLGHMHYLLPHLREPYEGLYQLYDKYGRNGVMAMHFGPYKFVLLGEEYDRYANIKFWCLMPIPEPHDVVNRPIFARRPSTCQRHVQEG